MLCDYLYKNFYGCGLSFPQYHDDIAMIKNQFMPSVILRGRFQSYLIYSLFSIPLSLYSKTTTMPKNNHSLMALTKVATVCSGLSVVTAGKIGGREAAV